MTDKRTLDYTKIVGPGVDALEARKGGSISILNKHRERLLNARIPARYTDSGEPYEADGTYGVSTEGNDCVISMGLIPSFRVPKEVAVKFALLILGRCGVEVERG